MWAETIAVLLAAVLVARVGRYALRQRSAGEVPRRAREVLRARPVVADGIAMAAVGWFWWFAFALGLAILGRVVRELMTPQSPYVLALRQTGDAPDRADFLGRWRGLIAETVDRLLQSSTPGATNCSSAQPWRDDVDAQQMAVLILAALHGGGTLSQVAQDPRILNAALDIALAPFAPPPARGDHTTTEHPDQ